MPADLGTLGAQRGNNMSLGHPAKIGDTISDACGVCALIPKFHADRPVLDDILIRLKNGEKLNGYPARLRTRDGSIRHVEISSSGLFRNGEFVSTRCFTVDVSDLEQARAALHAKDEQIRFILDSLPAAVYTTDAQG